MTWEQLRSETTLITKYYGYSLFPVSRDAILAVDGGSLSPFLGAIRNDFDLLDDFVLDLVLPVNA